MGRKGGKQRKIDSPIKNNLKKKIRVLASRACAPQKGPEISFGLHRLSGVSSEGSSVVLLPRDANISFDCYPEVTN